MRYAAIILFLLCTSALLGQVQPDQKPTPISPSARLAAAKRAYVKNAGGSDIPFNVIESGIEGWGRFTLVDSPRDADVIIEVESPEEDSGATVSSSTDTRGHSSTTSSRDITVSIIKLTVYDAHTHLPLWTANERPKGGFKEKTRDDNLVKSAERLLSRFRDRLEPPPAGSQTPPAKDK
jgi:hypothetical protein